MGREVRIHKNGTFSLWSTITDSWVLERASRAEILQEYNADFMLRARLQLIEKYFNFPHYLSDHDGPGLHQNTEGSAAFFKWQEGAFREDYEKAVELKYREILKEIQGDKDGKSTSGHV